MAGTGYTVRANLVRRNVRVGGTVDPETGEVTPAQDVSVLVDKSRYVKVYDPARLVALSEKGFRVLLYVMSGMGYGEQVRFSVRDCESFTGLRKSAAYAGLKEIADLDVVSRVRAGVYAVNPNVMYRGKRESRPRGAHPSPSPSSGAVPD